VVIPFQSPPGVSYCRGLSSTNLLIEHGFFLVVSVQGHMLARQALFHLSHISSPFVLGIFQIGSQIYAQAGLYRHLPIYSSSVTGMTGMHHNAQL
jgi:hypothetical protein